MPEIHLFDSEEETLPFAAGQTIFREGNRGDCKYAVVDGEVEILVGDDVIAPP
jgi:CRP-like cAMP-binding protein